MKNLELRECQKPMVEFMLNHERGNIFASPGTGKTAATLTALDWISAVDDEVFPVLVVAPLRVANLVWSYEASEWKQLSHLRISKIIGTKEARSKALNAGADIYVINYENLKWLHGELNGTWPFKTVVCDESTKIKNHSVHYRMIGGKLRLVAKRDGSNATCLVRNLEKTKRWYNLTGTPAPNGIADLWGQQLPVDYGDSLGKSRTAFLDSWFRTSLYGGFSKPEPREGAFASITELMKPHSVVVDAYDYFDIKKPIERNLYVELPDKPRKLYKTMHNLSVIEMQESEAVVTAVNAGSAVMKCRQIASGGVKDDDGNWNFIHDEKLHAVQELIDEIQSPLVVAYWFQHDLEQLKKRFKDAVVLEAGKKQAEIISQWNKGKIPLLLIHAQSAGHGLSLQHGGNHLCVYTQDWNAEYYAQVIERIGPTRQAQSGYDRPVYVHRIVAKNTWEEVVLDRVQNKITLDQAIRKAVNMEV